LDEEQPFKYVGFVFNTLDEIHTAFSQDEIEFEAVNMQKSK
jgi:hypothetical protein